MEIYRAEHLSLKLNQETTLNDVSFKILDGEIVVIHSFYGEGKALLKLLYLETKPIAGSLFYANQNTANFNHFDVAEWRVSDVQYVKGEETLFLEFTVKDNIYLPLLINKKPIDNTYIDQLISRFGLTEKLQLKASTLSETEKVKVRILRAMVLKPFVILLEDPTRNLDPLDRSEIVGLLSSINDVYKTTIIHETSYYALAKTGSRRLFVASGVLREVV